MTPGLDVDALRADTPGCAHIVHLNNAGAALPPRPVLDTVIEHLRREARIGGYEAAAEAHDRIGAIYDSIARLIGCDHAEVSLVESATRAWTTAFLAIPFRSGDRIITGRSEYASNAMAMLQLAETKGVVIDLIGDDESGQIDLAELDSRLGDDVRAVALTHVPTSGGLVNPAREVGQRARAVGAWFVLDACQSAGHLPLDVDEIGCDVLSATGRKFLRGPRGTGFLYVRADRRDELRPQVIDMQSATWTSPTTFALQPDGRRFETFESSVANRLGLGAAVDYALSLGIEAISDRALALASRARSLLGAIDGVAVLDKGVHRGAIVTFSVAGRDAAEVSDRLRADDRVNTAVSLVTHAQFDFPQRGLDAVVRASPHYYNTEDEIDLLARAVERLARS